MKKTLTLAGLSILLAFTLTAPAGAQTQTVPQLINFQAYLTNSLGTPLNGPQTVTFAIYNVKAGGAPLWSEIQVVTVNKGVTDVLLGNANPLTNTTTTPDALFAGGTRYLGVKVGTDTEMVPRKRITSVGYALNAGMLNGKLPSFILPPGSVIAYAGATVPDGFLECDGDPHAISSFPDLYNAIGTMYGGSATTFNVPNYQGYFLRGWAKGAAADPDRDGRTNRGDGTIGDNVGTKQDDAFQGHYHDYHTYWRDYVAATQSGRYFDHLGHGGIDEGITDRILEPIDDGTHGEPRTSTETRPINIYVMYIIKY
ncbi:MAG: tail fiber protein [Deltaproteobacteria bacterium]|nr:MAG: tail fiber protein [Deltaproteobacteria bacterium]